MKKIFTTLAVFLMLASFSVTAFAEDSQSSNVTITVVMPENETQSETVVKPTDSVGVYPVDVTENFDGNNRQIIKTYELSSKDNPADIPRSDFERNGWNYTLTDILKHETANAKTREHKETVELNTDTKDLETILTLLEPTMEYTSEDKYVGILTLDVGSIKVETAGTKTSSYEMKVTREYPQLSNNDTSLVPKTTTQNGVTYNLANVDWKAGNYETIDYERVPEYYTAIATYTATGYSTKATGYITTAEYTGTLAKLSQGKTVYTAYFEGKEIRTPLEMAELPTGVVTSEISGNADTLEENDIIDESNKSDNTALYIIIGSLVLLVLAGAIYIVKTGKEYKKYESKKNSDSNSSAIDGGNADNTNVCG